jgi:hypothetical protein
MECNTAVLMAAESFWDNNNAIVKYLHSLQILSSNNLMGMNNTIENFS